MRARLPPDPRVFEYGSGGSTLWFAGFARMLVSVEHDAGWHARVTEELHKLGAEHCTFLLRPPGPGAPRAILPAELGISYASLTVPGDLEEYVRAIDSYPDESFDLVLIDGRARTACMAHAQSKVRRGGLIVLDDSDRDDYEPAKRLVATWPKHEFRGIRHASLGPDHFTTSWIHP
jgi:hypothetical protein